MQNNREIKPAHQSGTCIDNEHNHKWSKFRPAKPSKDGEGGGLGTPPSYSLACGRRFYPHAASSTVFCFADSVGYKSLDTMVSSKNLNKWPLAQSAFLFAGSDNPHFKEIESDDCRYRGVTARKAERRRSDEFKRYNILLPTITQKWSFTDGTPQVGRRTV